jgi:hypothetical protein
MHKKFLSDSSYFIFFQKGLLLELLPCVRYNHSLKLTENTACFSAARKNLFREIATRAARIVCDDLAARCRSLAPVR